MCHISFLSAKLHWRGCPVIIGKTRFEQEESIGGCVSQWLLVVHNSRTYSIVSEKGGEEVGIKLHLASYFPPLCFYITQEPSSLWLVSPHSLYHNSSLIFMKNIAKYTKKLLCDFGVLLLGAHNLKEIYD